MNFKFFPKILTVIALSQMALFCSSSGGPVMVLDSGEDSKGPLQPPPMARSLSCGAEARLDQRRVYPTADAVDRGYVHVRIQRPAAAACDPLTPTVSAMLTFSKRLQSSATMREGLAQYLAAANSMTPEQLVAHRQLCELTDPVRYINFLEQEIGNLEGEIRKCYSGALNDLSLSFYKLLVKKPKELSMCTNEDAVVYLLNLAVELGDDIAEKKIIADYSAKPIEPQQLISTLKAARLKAESYRAEVTQKEETLEVLRKIRYGSLSKEEKVAEQAAKQKAAEEPQHRQSQSDGQGPGGW